MKACIFDLDGVIVDTAKYHFQAWKKLGATLGITLTEEDNEKLKGVGRMESLEIILSLGGLTKSEKEKQQLTEKKNEWFVDYIDAMRSDEIFPGVKGLLSELKRDGVRVALASSSRNAMTVIDKLGIADRFEVIVDGTMIANSKPDPEIFLTAAERMGVSPEDCVVVEDAEAGVEAAKRAGMKCIGVGKPAQLGKADAIVEQTGQIDIELLQNRI